MHTRFGGPFRVAIVVGFVVGLVITSSIGPGTGPEDPLIIHATPGFGCEGFRGWERPTDLTVDRQCSCFIKDQKFAIRSWDCLNQRDRLSGQLALLHIIFASKEDKQTASHYRTGGHASNPQRPGHLIQFTDTTFSARADNEKYRSAKSAECAVFPGEIR